MRVPRPFSVGRVRAPPCVDTPSSPAAVWEPSDSTVYLTPPPAAAHRTRLASSGGRPGRRVDTRVVDRGSLGS